MKRVRVNQFSVYGKAFSSSKDRNEIHTLSIQIFQHTECLRFSNLNQFQMVLLQIQQFTINITRPCHIFNSNNVNIELNMAKLVEL